MYNLELLSRKVIEASDFPDCQLSRTIFTQYSAAFQDPDPVGENHCSRISPVYLTVQDGIAEV